MKIEYKASFQKSFARHRNSQLASAVIKIINQLKTAEKITEISGLKNSKSINQLTG